jgi:hypothetical protein
VGEYSRDLHPFMVHRDRRVNVAPLLLSEAPEYQAASLYRHAVVRVLAVEQDALLYTARKDSTSSLRLYEEAAVQLLL